MSAPVVYRSTDASAPTLSGTAGDLITVLDAVLVNGYGSGAQASGAGWSKSYASSTTGATYRMGGGNQFYLNVTDSAPSTAKEARVYGAEVMSAFDTVTSGRFPTTAQGVGNNTGYMIARKSSTADATTRPWIIVADDRTIYMFVQTADSAGVYLAWMFGDFYSLLSGDGFRTTIIARDTENSSTVAFSTPAGEVLDLIAVTSASQIGHYVARAYTGSGGSLNTAKTGDTFGKTSGPAAAIGPYPYPNPTDGGVYLSRVYVIEAANSGRRGWMRGFYMWGHAVSGVIDGDTFTATSGDFNGRTFLIIKGTGNGAVYVIETSNTWDTSS